MSHFNKHLNNVVTYLPISDTLLKCVSFVFDVAYGKAGLTLSLLGRDSLHLLIPEPEAAGGSQAGTQWVIGMP